MKTVTMNSAAATSVMTTMETILSTTVGTATEGAVTMTGEEYLEAITIFVQLLEMDESSCLQRLMKFPPVEDIQPTTTMQPHNHTES